MPKKIPIPTGEELAGLNRREIAGLYGVSEATASIWVAMRGLPVVRAPRRDALAVPSFEELDGLSIRETQVKFGVSSLTARKWRELRGIQRKQRTQRVRTPQTPMQGLTEEARMIVCMPFLRDAQLARAFFVSREWVGQLREKIGVRYLSENREQD